MSYLLIYYLRSTSIVCILLCLSACAPPVKVAVEERAVLSSRQQSEDIGGQVVRIVQSGDTLYSIAFESNLDVNQLAAWNGITDVRDIPVGQRVRLTKPIGFVAKPVKQTEPIKSPDSPTLLESEKQPATVAVQTPSNKVLPPKSQTKPSQANTVNPVISNAVAGVAWSWPFKGKVIRRFSASRTQQGVDILGTNGQAVTASASGQVVYAGNSLKGYGNLMIFSVPTLITKRYW